MQVMAYEQKIRNVDELQECVVESWDQYPAKYMLVFFSEHSVVKNLLTCLVLH